MRVVSMKWMRWVSAMWFALVCGQGLCEELSLKGTVIDSDSHMVKGVELKLCKYGTDEVVTSAESGAQGEYDLAGFPPGAYTVSLDREGYLHTTYDFQLMQSYEGVTLLINPDPAAKARELEEVQVIAKALKSYAGRYEMYLTDFNRNFGVNALDAVSSLPKFVPAINSEALLNEKMDEVSLLIDGRRADPEQLRNLTGKDIAKVIYYQDAPAQYAGMYGGAVANIILRRPKELRVNGRVDASTALTTAYTSDRAGLTILSPYSLFNSGYSFGYTNNGRLRTRTTYDYGDLVNDFSSRSSRLEEKGNRAYVSYQLDRGKDLLYAQFDYSCGDRHTRYDEDLLEKTASTEIAGDRLTTLHRTTDRFSLDLYWGRTFGTGQELMVDLVGTLAKNHNDIRIDQTAGEGSAYDDFINDSRTGALVRSVIATVSYTAPLLGGQATAAFTDTYRHVRQDYTDNLFPDLPSLNRTSNNYANLDLGYNRHFGRFGMNLKLMLMNNSLSTAGGGSHNDFNVYPRVDLSWHLSNAVTLGLNTHTEGTLHGIGRQNQNRSLLDTRYYRENIPYMKPTQRLDVTVTSDITLMQSRLMLWPYVSYIHGFNDYIPYIYREGDTFIQRPTLLPSYNEVAYGMSAMWMPLASMQVRPMLNGTYKAFSTPVGRERFNAVQAVVQCIWMLKEVQLQLTVYTPKNAIEGIMRKHEGWNVGVSGYWKRGPFYAGLSMSYSGQSTWQRMAVEGFSSYNSDTDLTLRNNVQLSLGYTFEKGKGNRKSNRTKMLYNEERESGI